MRIDVIRTVALGLGLSVGGWALAADSRTGSGAYVSPGKWSNFNVTSMAAPPDRIDDADLDRGRLSEDQIRSHSDILPLPPERPAGPTSQSSGSSPNFSEPPQRFSAPQPAFSGISPFGASPYAPRAVAPDRSVLGHSVLDQSAYGSGVYGSGLAGEFGAGCEPPQPSLFPWFGGADLLFWSASNRTNRRLLLDSAMPATTLLNTRDADPRSGLGYDVFFGRYLEDGRHAISLNYLHFDPSRRGSDATATLPGDFMAAMPAWQNVGYYDDPEDLGSDFYDMQSIFSDMTDYRVRRDVGFQGLELNFWSFGLGGARRVGTQPGSGVSCGLSHIDARLGAQRQRAHGFGGFGGPLETPCVGSGQFALLHGFRWFQVRDDFLFAAAGEEPIDGPFQGEQFYNSRARNDLFGYQLGGRWNYCASPRWNLGLGAKLGIYANSVEVAHRMGDATGPALYGNDLNAAARHEVDDTSRSTVLAGLGEIDLGAGFRLTDAWTIRGGYRILGVSGVATTPGMLAHEMFSPSLSARELANESLILHGAYVGTEFNW